MKCGLILSSTLSALVFFSSLSHSPSGALRPDESEEKAMHGMVNRARAARGIARLSWDDRLGEIARAHSQDMHDRHFFSHQNPNGESPFDRGSDGENIAFGYGSTLGAHRALMRSPGHRANILRESFDTLGVGMCDAGCHWTQSFGQCADGSCVPSPVPDDTVMVEPQKEKPRRLMPRLESRSRPRPLLNLLRHIRERVRQRRERGPALLRRLR